jgi:hypothetical protein
MSRPPGIVLQTCTARSAFADRDRRRRRLRQIAPLLIVGSMAVLFQTLTARCGYPLGYLLAFVVYWVAWCCAFPVGLLGPREILLPRGLGWNLCPLMPPEILTTEY